MSTNEGLRPDAPSSEQPPAWTNSLLVERIITALHEPRSLAALAADLGVTDARILFYLDRLERIGWVSRSTDQWRTTAAASLRPAMGVATDRTVLPFGSTQDYEQAYADAAAGMFGSGYVQAAGEHGGRVPGERVAEFNERLKALIEEYFSPAVIDRTASPKYGFRWILTPVDLHPLDDQ